MLSRTTFVSLLIVYYTCNSSTFNSYSIYQANAFILPSTSTSSPKIHRRTSPDHHHQQLIQIKQQQNVEGLLKLFSQMRGDEEGININMEMDTDMYKTLNGSPSSPPPSSSTPSTFNTKLLRLKDRMWVRETLEDLTAAEFAINLAPRPSDGEKEKERKAKSAGVDFENLLAKLDKRIDDMCVRSTYGSRDAACIVTYPIESENEGDSGSDNGESEKVTSSILSDAFPKDDDECWSLMENYGMGSVTYTDDQRSALVLRLLASRQELLKAMAGAESEANNGESSSANPNISSGNLDQIREKLQKPDLVADDERLSGGGFGLGPSVYVRDDGTVDWDGALQDRAALQKFGISVWARINGQDPESIDEESVGKSGSGLDGEHGNNKVTAKIVETEAIREKKERVDVLKAELDVMEKKHTALLNSAVSAGSAVANVNFALLEPELRSKIRASANKLEMKKDEVSFETLIYELERIYTYLDGELGNTATKGYIPLQDRVNVAEFGLLESQIESMNSQINSGGTVDSDVLAVVMEQTTDFKRRLGIDYYVTGLTLDQEGIKIWLNDLGAKLQSGLAFYGKGIQLFFSDLVFSTTLIGRALTGYTLKPREVRTLRRTFKDVITFIPFAIIWAIPLSPVGHALVFGAIQRFFPDFFPSPFTDRRQNLLALYESTEFSEFTIDENWKEKLIRILEAAGFFMVDNTKKLFAQVTDRDEPNTK